MFKGGAEPDNAGFCFLSIDKKEGSILRYDRLKKS